MVVSSTFTDRIRVGRHLDGRNVAHVRATVHAVIESATGDVLVDVSAVEMVDGAALGMLTAAHVRAQRRGVRLVLANPSRELRRVLAVTRLNRVLHLSRDEYAVAS